VLLPVREATEPMVGVADAGSTVLPGSE